jgi:hypothetical protein
MGQERRRALANAPPLGKFRVDELRQSFVIAS